MRKISALQLSIHEKAAALVAAANEKNITFGTAESCTGGLISAAVTDIAGASAVFWGGIVSYDNSVKSDVLGVKRDTLKAVGAVSAETAGEMALGAIRCLGVDAAVAVTGIAGPGGGTPEKPVGLVYIAAAQKDGSVFVGEHHFAGDRTEVRLQTVEAALMLLTEILK